MEDIKKRAETYKSKNGNSNITNKDLLFYIIARLDELEKVIKRGIKKWKVLRHRLEYFGFSYLLVLLPVL